MLTWVFVYTGATDQMPSSPRSSLALSGGSCPGRRRIPQWPSPTPLPRTMHVVSVPATAFVATTAIRRVAIWHAAIRGVTPILAHTTALTCSKQIVLYTIISGVYSPFSCPLYTLSRFPSQCHLQTGKRSFCDHFPSFFGGPEFRKFYD